MKPKYIFPLLAVLLITAGCTAYEQKKINGPTAQPEISTVTVGKKTLNVEVMNTDAKREQGLSGRESLAPNSGMLFDFTNSKIKLPGFWMKDMKFDIDIIWIAGGKIIAINRSVPKPDANIPLEQLTKYFPPAEIDYVLEVNAGWSQKNNIEIGELVSFK